MHAVFRPSSFVRSTGIKFLIRSLPQNKAESILQQCLQMDNVQEIRALLHYTLHEFNLHELIK